MNKIEFEFNVLKNKLTKITNELYYVNENYGHNSYEIVLESFYFHLNEGLGKFLSKNIFNVKKRSEELWNKGKDIARSAIDAINRWADKIKNSFRNMISDIRNDITNLPTITENIWNEVLKGMDDLKSNFKESIVEPIQNKIDEIINGIKEEVKGYKDEFIQSFNENKDKFIEKIKKKKENIIASAQIFKKSSIDEMKMFGNSIHTMILSLDKDKNNLDEVENGEIIYYKNSKGMTKKALFMGISDNGFVNAKTVNEATFVIKKDQIVNVGGYADLIEDSIMGIILLFAIPTYLIVKSLYKIVEFIVERIYRYFKKEINDFNETWKSLEKESKSNIITEFQNFVYYKKYYRL